MGWKPWLAASILVAAQSSAHAGELELVWTPPDVPVRSYVIERRLDSDGARFASIVHVGSGAVRFLDESVTPGLRYCYRVRGIRSDGSSSASRALCARAGERPLRRDIAALEAPATGSERTAR